MKSCIIVCNGEMNKIHLKRLIRSTPESVIICCDGAANRLKPWGIVPGYIIGDFDGATDDTIGYFRKLGVKFKKVVNQNKNDLEKALDLAIAKKIFNVSVIGFAGGRLDHTFGNLSILSRYSRFVNITVYDGIFKGVFIRNKTVIRCRRRSTVSLMPVPRASGITTKGLKWKLRNEELTFSVREGTLNRSVSNKITIEIKKGVLLVTYVPQ
jgi:thiamine pyrophosphokinase